MYTSHFSLFLSCIYCAFSVSALCHITNITSVWSLALSIHVFNGWLETSLTLKMFLMGSVRRQKDLKWGSLTGPMMSEKLCPAPRLYCQPLSTSPGVYIHGYSCVLMKKLRFGSTRVLITTRSHADNRKHFGERVGSENSDTSGGRGKNFSYR